MKALKARWFFSEISNPFRLSYSQLLGEVFEQLAEIEIGTICVSLYDGSYRR